ncbi:ABC transporter permease [Mesorhizobium atlanticum]|uniref:ABC transporter permease n=1 Tax=Mesorhizobium atlanticum TaxID=2233532 RepID=A0A330GJ05_9HYPH|nr:ABC transporter permease [Mesorhizobium atlanticum]RAZ72353.1 ABC transporter permease [Mesorhizobium atlanticum]
MTSAALIVNRMLTPRRPISRGVTLGAGSILSSGILLTWCVATYGGLADPLFLPAPHRVIGAFWHSLMDGSLLRNTWASLLVINVGFLLSSLVAVPLGILMGSFRVVAAALEPIVNFTRYLPVTSMIPLLILWIGIGFEEKVAVIFIGTFFQQIVMISDVSARVPAELFNASYTLGATRWQVVTRMLLPATLPGVMDTLRVTMGWAWTYLVVAELVASSSGLGYMSMQAMRGLHAEYIFVGILVIGLLGLATDQIFKWIKIVCLPWAEQR